MKICKRCGANNCTSRGYGKYRDVCTSCHRKPWVQFKKDFCEKCGFVPVHPIQLDVDHMDGNKENNSSGNLQTLCANCHRLKTHLNSDYLQKGVLKKTLAQLALC